MSHWMTARVGISAAAIFATSLLMVARVRADELHLQIDPQQSQISTSVADPLGRLRETGEIEATFRIKSGSIDGDPQHPAQTGHVKLEIDATTFDSGNTHRDNVVLGTALNTAQYQTSKLMHRAKWAMLPLLGTSHCMAQPASSASRRMLPWTKTASSGQTARLASTIAISVSKCHACLPSPPAMMSQFTFM
jgi:hypothetical protein